MRTSDVMCPNCGSGYRRIELATRPGNRGEFRCLLCDEVLELFDGAHEVAIRLTVQSSRLRDNGDSGFQPEPAAS
jgi:transposase-like protein